MTTSDSYSIPISNQIRTNYTDQFSSSPTNDHCLTQIPSWEFDKAVFLTIEGYREGYILSQNETLYNVYFYRNESGECIDNIGIIPIINRVTPKRLSSEAYIFVNVRSDKQISGNGFIRSGYPIDVGYGIGSGLNGGIVERSGTQKYPIYSPLTLHSVNHRKTLTRASQMIVSLLVEYLQFTTISNESLDRACWLINTVLYIDGFSKITSLAFLEALTDFVYDYSNLPTGTIIRQPINYILDIAGIDGIYSGTFSPSVSFIPTNYEGVVYHTNDSRSDI